MREGKHKEHKDFTKDTKAIVRTPINDLPYFVVKLKYFQKIKTNYLYNFPT